MPIPSESQFKLLFESVPGLYLILQSDLTIAAASDAYLQATMTKREDILGRYLFEVFPDNPDDPAATGVSNLRISLHHVLEHKESHTMAVQKYDIRRTDGSFEERYWSPLNKPVLNENGDLLYIIHRVEDVTDFMMQEKEGQAKQKKITDMEMEIYKRAQEIQENSRRLMEEVGERKKTEQKFKGLLESAPDAMVITDRKGEIVLVNNQAVKLFGYEVPELIGMPIELLIPQELRTIHEQHRETYYQQPKIRSMGVGLELFAVHKDGTQIPVEISLSPLETSDGMMVYAAIRDITERKMADEAIRHLNKELESFTYSVSHDLRAPLRIIDGYADILIEDYSNKLDGESGRMLGVIKSNARRMGQLIDDLLTLSHTGRKEPIRQLTDMNKLVRSVIEEQASLAGHSATFNVQKLDPAECDSSLIRQVWVNFISNAIKYSGKEEKPLIEISSQRQGSEIIYTVKDNGVGFDMKYADKLFGVFQRLHKTSEFEGTGIGLALVNRIIIKHGGRVWANAEPDKGASFFFALPG